MGRFAFEASSGAGVDPRGAGRGLPRLAAWAFWPIRSLDGEWPVEPGLEDSPPQVALRELEERHRDDPPARVEAYAEAMALLDRLGAQEAFGRWESDHKGVAADWATSEGAHRRRRLEGAR
jgi:hypothetical protein